MMLDGETFLCQNDSSCSKDNATSEFLSSGSKACIKETKIAVSVTVLYFRNCLNFEIIWLLRKSVLKNM